MNIYEMNDEGAAVGKLEKSILKFCNYDHFSIVVVRKLCSVNRAYKLLSLKNILKKCNSLSIYL